ncbi:MAG: hypothetical protein AAF430_08785 [Myxococcota bacterium]
MHFPDVLVAEFLESYYQVEGKLDPEREDERLEASLAEIVLEPYFDSLELHSQMGPKTETITCLSGAFAPVAGEQHPALERSGVDFVGVRQGRESLVFGVTDPEGEDSPFVLLLRGLNCLAELSPPFQMARLGRHVLKNRVGQDARFDLQLGIPKRERGPSELSLWVLTRDLAEVFKARIAEEAQFRGEIGLIECVELPDGENAALRVRWRA